MIDPRLHVAVIVHPSRVLGTLLAVLAVVVLSVVIVGLWLLMQLLDGITFLLHLVFSSPLLTAGALMGGMLLLAGSFWLCRATYRFLMTS